MLKKITLGVLMAGMMTVSVGEAQAAKRMEDANRLPDNAPVQVYGQVADITEERLVVDYGEGIVEINLSNIDDTSSLGQLHTGDMVTVLGHVFNPLSGPKEILADRIAFLKDQGQEQQTPQQTAPGQTTLGDAITGEVVGIFGRNLMLSTDHGTVTVNTIPIEKDPTGSSVSPAIEKGDQVRLRVQQNQSDRWLASEVLGVKKSYQNTFIEQRLAENSARNTAPSNRQQTNFNR